MKKCSICKKLLSDDKFYRRGKNSEVLCSYCKDCDIKRVKKYQKDNIEIVRSKNRKWHKENKEEINKRRRADYQENIIEERKKIRKYYKKNRKKILKRNKERYPETREKKISQTYFRNYGITLKEKKEILIKQNYKCAICRKKIKINANLDHCHKTKKIRGILCPSCNRGIGYLGDSIKILNSAIKYLRK